MPVMVHNFYFDFKNVILFFLPSCIVLNKNETSLVQTLCLSTIERQFRKLFNYISWRNFVKDLCIIMMPMCHLNLLFPGIFLIGLHLCTYLKHF